MSAIGVSPEIDAQALFACAPTQAGMVFESLTDPSRQYVEQVAVTLREVIDPVRLEQAWAHLAARHEALRLSFLINDQAPLRQRVAAAVQVPFVVSDWRAMDPRGREERWSELLHTDSEASFSLETAPLFRVTLCLMDNTESRMLFTSHHAIIDGYSGVQLQHELFLIYEGLGKGALPQLPEAPSFRLFAIWNSERADNPAAADFWRQALTGIEAPTPPPRSGDGDAAKDDLLPGGERLQLNVRLSDQLRDVAGQCGQSLATLLQAAFAVVLAQECGQEDLLFATTRAGRQSPPFDTTDMVGVLMVASPLRVRASAEDSLMDLVTRLHEWSMAVRPWEHTPLVEIRRASAVPPMRQLTEVLFNFLPRSAEGVLRELDAAWETREVTVILRTGAALTLTASGDASIGLEVLWDGASCTGAAGRRFLRRLDGVLNEIARTDATVALGELGRMSDSQCTQLSGELDVFAPPTEDELVPALFARSAAAHPNRVALVHQGARLSYAELDARAGAIATRLFALGVAREERVGVAMRRGPELVSAVLAVHRVGGAYVPLDPRYPTERLRFMLADSGARVVITDPPSAAVLPDDGCEYLVLDGKSSENSPLPQAARVLPADLSHVIYTSGSTGRPKGVMIEHGAVAALVRWARDTFSDQERDGVLASTSLSFDLSVFELLVTLALGGRVVLVDDLLALSDPDFSEHVALINGVPSAMSQLLSARALSGSVRTVTLAGEALSRTLVERLYAQAGVQRVWNLYGPSEDTTYSTAALCVKGSPGQPPIGRPLPGTQAYVLNTSLLPVSVGVPGELLLGGAGLARGYLDRAELTRERFVPNPFSREPSARLYRTGDQVTWRMDGTLEYHHRLDDQVKIRGFRIEPGEVRYALLEDDRVQDAVVVVGGEGARGLVAYVVGRTHSPLDVDDVRRRLATRLPAQLVPRFVVQLDALPLTPNGKVDREALPELARPTRATADTTPAERALAALWQQLLELDVAPAANDDFFDLGGDSLLALSLLAGIEDRFGTWLGASAVVESPTLAGMAARLGPMPASQSESPIIPLRATGSQRPWFFVLTDHRGVIGLRNVLPALMHDQPVYAVQAIDPANPSWRESSVHAIAEACLRAIIERQPHGPYRLGGYSLGGYVSWELACRLEDLGERVELLALLDTLAPEAFSWIGRLAVRRRELRGLSRRRLLRGYAGVVKLSAQQAIRLTGRRPADRRAWPRGFDDPMDDAGAMRLLRRYRPRIFSGPVVVCYTDQSLVACAEPTLGWERHAGGRLDTARLPGDHHSVLAAANIAKFASLLAERLERLNARALDTAPRTTDRV
jgi:amino acid adenylation domain-containing protein